MKYSLLFLSAISVLTLSACAVDHNSGKKSSWLCCGIPPMEWPRTHWKGQSFEPDITNQAYILPDALDRSRSMFDDEDIENLSPQDFVNNLHRAGIISKVYYAKSGLVYNLTGQKKYDHQTGVNTYDVVEVGDMVVDLDANFYTLTRADQVIIGELLIQAYDEDLIVLKDTHTDKMVGQIRPEGLSLF